MYDLTSRVRKSASRRTIKEPTSPGCLYRGALAALALAALNLSAPVAHASDPVGIYAVVDRVVLEPSEAAPERIQVWGTFSVATGIGNTYTKPQRGFLYYSVNTEKPGVCRNEWSDLKRVAGKQKIVGFGSRYGEKGRIRKPDEKAAEPDRYVLGWGMVNVAHTDSEPFRSLLAASKHASPPSAQPPIHPPAAHAG